MPGRDLTVPMQAEIAAAVIRPAYFVEMETGAATIYVWSGLGIKDWDYKSWEGVGEFGAISTIPETSGVNAVGITLTLSGIPSDMLTLLLTDFRSFKPLKVWFALLDEDGDPVLDPYLAFSGRTDKAKLFEGSAKSSIMITGENRLIELNRSRERRYTDEDQHIEFPGDKGFEFVEEITSEVDSWGQQVTPSTSRR